MSKNNNILMVNGKNYNKDQMNSKRSISNDNGRGFYDEPSSPRLKPLDKSGTLKTSKRLSQSMLINDNNSPTIKKKSFSKTLQTVAILSSLSRASIQGVLVRFFRNGDPFHTGVKLAINEFEIKSWEAFLIYLNQQAKLVLSTGAIQHVYTLNGQEIRSINQLENRQSYVVASGSFTQTNYRHLNDGFNDESQATGIQENKQKPTDKLLIIPYSRLNTYETMMFNRNIQIEFDQWLNDEVTALLSHYIDNKNITHLYAVTKSAFVEIKGFSHLFNVNQNTDTFIACTNQEFEHSKRFLSTKNPDEILDKIIKIKKSKTTNGQRNISKQIHGKLSIKWIHGYNGNNEQTKTIYNLPENEILYIIGSICILYRHYSKQQRFYTKHTNPITCIDVHSTQSIVASNEIVYSNDRAHSLIHIWDYNKLEIINELRQEQFGSDISILSFSKKSNDNWILIVSFDYPNTILIVDWKRNEIVHMINTKIDDIISTSFVFNTTDWIACMNEQHFCFYNINLKSKPIRVKLELESDAENNYTATMACDRNGKRLIIGDTAGNVHVWDLIDNEPRLIIAERKIFENNVKHIISMNENIFIFTNGENLIKFWNIELNRFELVQLKHNVGLIQTICLIEQGLVIGTNLNYILFKENNSDRITIILRGPLGPSTWFCCDQNNEEFYSISSNRYLFKWNNQTRFVEWAIQAPHNITCADLHPERNLIVLGSESNKLFLYDTLSSFYITTIRLKVNTTVATVRFSPNGQYLAIGLQNGTVSIYDIIGNGDFRPSASQDNSSSVIDTIWSTNSNHLLAIYEDKNYKIWSIPLFNDIKDKSIQSFQWYRATNPIACDMKDKSIVGTLASAIVLSPNAILCCGKDGRLRLVRNSYQNNLQTFQIGFGSIELLTSSTNPNHYLLSTAAHPTIIEIEINIEN